MTPPARRRKPGSAEETARVLTIFDMLWEELEKRLDPGPGGLGLDADELLTVAERIAARTED